MKIILALIIFLFEVGVCFAQRKVDLDKVVFTDSLYSRFMESIYLGEETVILVYGLTKDPKIEETLGGVTIRANENVIDISDDNGFFEFLLFNPAVLTFAKDGYTEWVKNIDESDFMTSTTLKLSAPLLKEGQEGNVRLISASEEKDLIVEKQQSSVTVDKTIKGSSRVISEYEDSVKRKRSKPQGIVIMDIKRDSTINVKGNSSMSEINEIQNSIASLDAQMRIFISIAGLAVAFLVFILTQIITARRRIDQKLESLVISVAKLQERDSGLDKWKGSVEDTLKELTKSVSENGQALARIEGKLEK